MANGQLLAASLGAAVHIEMLKLQDLTPEQRAAEVRSAGVQIGQHGDTLQYGGRGTVSVFATTARALAVLAYQPGGVTFAGMHFCARHELCEQAAKEVAQK
jgi:hypothetical protein